MTNPWIASLLALFVWWFSTGAILCAVKHADKVGGRAPALVTLASLPMLLAGAWLFSLSLAEETVANAYIAFLAAILIWGWIETAFLTGAVTGPNTRECPADRPEWERFIRAWGTIAYHEILLAGVLITLWLTAADAPNTVGIWTYSVLFFARISAKLNLFLGVPKINTEFLPTALKHLPSHFRIARVNWLFPISITALTFAVACWFERLYSAATPADIVGFSLLSAMTALALLEHWFMVLPLPDEKLWRWMLPAPKQQLEETKRGDVHGL